MVGAAPVPVLPSTGVSPGSQTMGAGDADAHATGASPSIEVSMTLSVNAALPSIMPGFSNIATDLAGTLDDARHPLDGGAAAGSGGEEVGISIAAGSGLVSSEISASISSQGAGLTLPRLPVNVKLPLSPFDPGGGSPVPGPPTGSTSPTSPDDPIGNPTAPGNPIGNPSAPTSGGGSTASPFPPSGSSGAGGSPGEGHAPSTGSTSGDPAQADGSAAGAQHAASLPNGGSTAISVVFGDATIHEAASSTTSPSISATVSGPT
jgi:hypothetical protein